MRICNFIILNVGTVLKNRSKTFQLEFKLNKLGQAYYTHIYITRAVEIEGASEGSQTH